jgi:hypothetical protein
MVGVREDAFASKLAPTRVLRCAEVLSLAQKPVGAGLLAKAVGQLRKC